MRVRVLGPAAGGGFPQWNCRCPTCEAARTGTAARPRTQSSIAIRGAEGPWFLANASPDLRQQLEAIAVERVNGMRAAPVAGVLLTDAEIDHTAGLLLLRESSTPLRIYGSEQVRRALTDGYPVLPILAEYSGVDWRSLEPGAAVAIDGSSLEVAPEIGIGNVIGSLVFSVTGKLGIVVLAGGSIAIGSNVLRWHLPALVLVTALAAYFLSTGQLERWHGFVLLALYITYWIISFVVYGGAPVDD